MKVSVYDHSGNATGREVELNEAVFGIEPHDHAMYLAVKVQRARQRQGTHSAKNRSMVRGGGRKPWRQKGRGTARVGTIRSPLWRHGGRIFPPHPHEYKMDLPKKVKQLARRSALSARAQEEAIRLVEEFSFDKPQTRQLRQVLQALDLQGEKVLILTKANSPNLVRSAQNLATCNVRVGFEASTYDLLNHRVLLIEEGALESITEVLGGTKRSAEEAA